MESLRGHLLIAGPALVDPNFWRTVVLIGEHTEEGALGVVLNRSSETSVEEALPELTPDRGALRERGIVLASVAQIAAAVGAVGQPAAEAVGRLLALLG